MLSSYEHERLREFYGRAPACAHLEKGGSWRYVQLLCQKTRKPCGPKFCPFEDFSSLLADKPEAPSLDPNIGPQLQLERPEANVKPEIDVTNPQAENVSKLHVIHRRQAKTHSKPHVEANSIIKRVLITFVAKSGKLRRWAFDCIFSPHTRKSAVLEFKGKTTKDARFYFRLGTDDETAKTVIGSWFANLQVHDESVAFNLVGSPESYSIEILDTD
jgi:hypothetical protein